MKKCVGSTGPPTLVPSLGPDSHQKNENRGYKKWDHSHTRNATPQIPKKKLVHIHPNPTLNTTTLISIQCYLSKWGLGRVTRGLGNGCDDP